MTVQVTHERVQGAGVDPGLHGHATAMGALLRCCNPPCLVDRRRELETRRGVYIVRDSRDPALYAGKARRQSLWKEINLVLNRNRQLQHFRRVDHPERRQDFRTSDHLRRQIRTANVRLHELATYVSACQVADGVIGNWSHCSSAPSQTIS